jgi:23S rRNA pseudouridine1911/1915/1917 synthase
MQITLQVPADLAKAERLDRYLAGHRDLSDHQLSRSQLQRLIKNGQVQVDENTVAARQLLHGGETISLDFADRNTSPPLPQPEDIPLVILFEDEHLIVVDKPHGLVVHPGAGNDSGTLVNALLHHCDGKLATRGLDPEHPIDPERPGIVHRLDRDTSGCLIAAKTDQAHAALVEQFSTRTTEKIYHCVVAGHPASTSGTIESNISRHPVHRQRMANVEPPAGKQAVTAYRIVGAAADSTWTHIECQLHTGRTHQIRVHMKESLRTPILGDPIYGNPKRDPVKVPRLMLHAHQLGITHPTSKDRLSFTAPLPEAFEKFT